MYQIETRYEYWSADGKVWTPWFIYFGDKEFETKAEAEARIQFYKAADVSKKAVKINHEYRIINK